MYHKGPHEEVLDFIDQYEAPLLETEEEERLAKEIQGQAGKVREMAIERLVRSNLRFLYKVSMEYWRKNQQLDLWDLFQSGWVGLRRAAESFTPSKGASFTTYSRYWIDSFIRRNTLHTPWESTELGDLEPEDKRYEEGGEGQEEIRSLFDKLTDEEKEILLLRSGKQERDPLSIKEIAATLKKTPEEALEIEISALRKLRKSKKLKMRDYYPPFLWVNNSTKPDSI